MKFFIPGDPVPQGRPRAYRMGDSVRMFDPPKSVAWKKIVAQVAILHHATVLDGALVMRLTFYLPAPKSINCPECTMHTKRPDLDNLVKSIKDGLNGICYKDDSQVYLLHAVKFYAARPDLTGVDVVIEQR